MYIYEVWTPCRWGVRGAEGGAGGVTCGDGECVYIYIYVYIGRLDLVSMGGYAARKAAQVVSHEEAGSVCMYIDVYVWVGFL